MREKRERGKGKPCEIVDGETAPKRGFDEGEGGRVEEG